MRRSVIIATTVICMMLCLSLIGFSVYAHLNQSFSVSNTIGFVSSQDIYVSLDCSVSGAKQTDIQAPPTGYNSVQEYYQDVGITKKVEFTEDMRLNASQNLGEWEIEQNLTFVDAITPITYTIVVYNYSDLPIRVYITDYIQQNADITNQVSQSVTIPGYNRNNNPSSGIVKLTSTVSYGSFGFNSSSNNFLVVFETVQN